MLQKEPDCCYSFGWLQFDDSALHRNRDGVRTVVRAKFREDVLDVALDCVLSNRELSSDQFVCIPAGKQAQDIDFSQGQRVIDRMFGELRSDLRRDALFSGMDGANSLQEF